MLLHCAALPIDLDYRLREYEGDWSARKGTEIGRGCGISEGARQASARPNKLITAGANRIGIVVLDYLNASDCSSATASRIAAARSNSRDFAA